MPQQINLNENETLLGKESASHIMKFLFLPQPNPGKLYVTNQRVFFEPTQGRLTSKFEYDLSEVESFSVGAMNSIILNLKNGKSNKITGMFNKKLVSYLEQAGVKKL